MNRVKVGEPSDNICRGNTERSEVYLHFERVETRRLEPKGNAYG